MESFGKEMPTPILRRSMSPKTSDTTDTSDTLDTTVTTVTIIPNLTSVRTRNHQSRPDSQRACCSTLERFQEGARNDLEKQQQTISDLVRPIRKSLDKFDTKIQVLETNRVGAYDPL